jgi:CBS-domain-containing membrane protein
MASRYYTPATRYDAAWRPSAYQRNPAVRSSDEVPVREVMTRDVRAVRPDDSIVRAAQLLRDEDVGALPVVDRRGRPIGMITDRDITCRLVADSDDIRDAQVHHAMTDEVFACPEESSIENCMRTMSRHQVRRVIVVDRNDRVVGIVSQADLARHAGWNGGAGERRAVADTMCAVSEPNSQPYR